MFFPVWIGNHLPRRLKMKDARILLVDDETVFANNMSKLLTRRGFQVTAVNRETPRSRPHG